MEMDDREGGKRAPTQVAWDGALMRRGRTNAGGNKMLEITTLKSRGKGRLRWGEHPRKRGNEDRR